MYKTLKEESVPTEHPATALELDRARRAIDTLINTCSQSIHEPLESICRLIQQIKQDSPLDELACRYLGTIESTVSKLNLTVTELEKFLISFQSRVAIATTDVAKMVDEIVRHHRRRIRAAKINVLISSDKSIPFHTDHITFRTILSHLISNALLYQDKKKAHKTVLVTITMKENHCKVEVKDNGKGIHADLLPHIFDLFFNRKPAPGTYGVGLYICRQQTLSLGGSLTVTSTYGEGSCFSLSVPNLLTTPPLHAQVLNDNVV